MKMRMNLCPEVTLQCWPLMKHTEVEESELIWSKMSLKGSRTWDVARFVSRLHIHPFNFQIILETEVSNTKALNLYSRLGFIRERRLYRYYLNGSDAFRLAKYLKQQFHMTSLRLPGNLLRVYIFLYSHRKLFLCPKNKSCIQKCKHQHVVNLINRKQVA